MGSVLTPLCSRHREHLRLRTRHLDDGASWVLELSGETDIASLGLLRRELAHLASSNRAEAVVDVARLQFCDVAAAELLLVAGRRIPFTLRGATGRVKRVLDLLDALHEQKLAHCLSTSTPMETARALDHPCPAQGVADGSNTPSAAGPMGVGGAEAGGDEAGAGPPR